MTKENPLMSAALSGSPEDIPDKVKLLTEFCEKYDIKEVWADFADFTKERNTKGHAYYVVDSYKKGKGINGILNTIFSPDCYSDDMELMMSTDIVCLMIAPDNPIAYSRSTDKLKDSWHLIYTKERGVILGE